MLRLLVLQPHLQRAAREWTLSQRRRSKRAVTALPPSSAPKLLPASVSPCPSLRLALTATMMFSGFNTDYEASSSRCSSASPAGDSLSYYHSPAESFSSMGSPVNAQVRLAPSHRGRGVRVTGEETPDGELSKRSRGLLWSRGLLLGREGGCPGWNSPISGAPGLLGAHTHLSKLELALLSRGRLVLIRPRPARSAWSLTPAGADLSQAKAG